MQHADRLREGERIFTICNSCRYCEGFCAVFPAMEKRITFEKDDLEYLANLCHNCTECLDACQYAPPHEFAVDVPKMLMEIREQTYRDRARPSRPMLAIALVSLIALLAGLWASPPPVSQATGFYAAFPYESMIAVFAILGAFALVAMLSTKWGGPPGPQATPRSLLPATKDALTLTYLGGSRRWFHHATFYGFLLCFASTTSAAFYHHVLDLHAPYPYSSLPVILGTLGGLGLLIGPIGLFLLKPRDLTFLAMLFSTSLTGLTLMLLRDTAAMPTLLYIHLGVVALLFLTMPYGKFVHGIYRSAALVRYAVERHASK